MAEYTKVVKRQNDQSYEQEGREEKMVKLEGVHGGFRYGDVSFRFSKRAQQKLIIQSEDETSLKIGAEFGTHLMTVSGQNKVTVEIDRVIYTCEILN